MSAEQKADSRPPLPKLAYTRTEAAQVLGVSPITIDRLTARGLLRPSRATRRPLYAHWELERFLRETTAGNEPV
jgi:Helix-turn-helix domain